MKPLALLTSEQLASMRKLPEVQRVEYVVGVLAERKRCEEIDRLHAEGKLTAEQAYRAKFYPDQE